MMIDYIWWERIANAAQFRNDIVAALDSGMSVMVDFPEHLPFEETFLKTIDDDMHRQNKEFEAKSAPPGTDPGEFLIHTYCTPQERAQYWPTESSSAFLANSRTTVLNRKHLCIKDIAEADFDHWYRFVKEYTQLCKEPGRGCTFLLASHNLNLTGSKQLACFRYQDYVTDYDCLMFCLTIASSLKCSSTKKQYIAETAFHMAEGNIPLAGLLAQEGEALAKAPIKAAHRIFTASGNMPDALEKMVKNAVWETQIKLIFPKIERYRNQFITAHDTALQGHLPIHGSNNEVVSEAKELELGQLYFLCHAHHLISKPEFEMLLKYRNARNKLAHLDTLTYAEMLAMELL